MPPKQAPQTNKPANKQVLPSKEQSCFKQLVVYYTEKQYKKGIKEADRILKSFPNHGETLSMKALILSCMGKKDESMLLAKEGVKNDISSFLCWHSLSIVHKADRNYAEAIKCCRNALKWGKDNQQIVKDLSTLLLQTRDISGYAELRRTQLLNKPNVKGNWLTFALGLQLAGSFTQAVEVLNKWENIDKPLNADIETTEYLLYKAIIIEESGNLQAALNYVNENEKLILDKSTLQETRGRLLHGLKLFEESKKVWLSLLNSNSEHHSYHRALIKTQCQIPFEVHTPYDFKKNYDRTLPLPELSREQIESLESLYDELLQKYPRSSTVKRVPLEFSLVGGSFERRLKEYVLPFLRKGIPSLFADLKSLYKDTEKVKVISDLFHHFESENQQGSESSNHAKPNGTDHKPEPPAFILWTYFFLGQHYDRLGDYGKALSYINKALSHTPTAIELYMAKSRILKHAGNLELAANVYNDARKMDLADRYLNTKSTKYLLRCDKRIEADRVISLFTKEGEDFLSYLYEMQATWFEIEKGDSFRRSGEYGWALRSLDCVIKHFDDIRDDEYDFHNYCMRKGTLSAYYDLLKFEDKLFAHKSYLLALKGIIRVYRDIFDSPKSAEKQEEKPVSGASKKQKEKEKEKEKEDERNKSKGPAKTKKGEKGKQQQQQQKTDEEIERPGLEKTPIPIPEHSKILIEASKYVQLLKKNGSDVEGHILAAEIYLRREKYLLVLQSLKFLLSKEPNNPQVHKIKIQFLLKVKELLSNSGSSSSSTVTLPAPVREILTTELEALLAGKSVVEINEEFLRQFQTSVSARTTAVELKLLLNPAEKDAALTILTNVEGNGTYRDHIAAFNLIEKLTSEESIKKKNKESSHQKFPHASFFSSTPETLDVSSLEDTLLGVDA
eukprot:TRINITY_DN3780_c0_g1_i1.p1 TRINITY_DN3780_c0_g1~~TRINITY_DN3780_c0_g1_i1.p1  ORF type:complete len:900 (+),score=223.42 TRINITY_DN3780_c0_g1_i1:541-3240(+)